MAPLPLADHGATTIAVGAIHLNGDGSVHLNDNPPADPKFDRMRTDLAAAQARCLSVVGMVGGAHRPSSPAPRADGVLLTIPFIGPL
ncbi:MAG TPA: hypothetical protein VGJ44_11825 [Kribbellaceae bacterium]